MVPKAKVSCGTKIEGDELFNFDKEVEPILGVLCNKLLEHSRMEVLEEEELKVIRGQQKHYAELKKVAEIETQRLEEEELQRQREIVSSFFACFSEKWYKKPLNRNEERCSRK